MPQNFSTPEGRAAEAALTHLRHAAIEQEITFSSALGALADRVSELMIVDSSLIDVRVRVARVLRG